VNSLKGELLLAGGGLLDLNFRQTVVLIAEHNDDGAVGVVLNRAASTPLSEAVPELTALPGTDDRLFVGGPVAPDNAVILAQFEHPDAADEIIFEDIGIHSPIDTPPVDPVVIRARVFAGYSGWGPGQLEAEMSSDAWLHTPAHVSDVFCGDPDELWREVIERMGPGYAMLRQMPFDPSAN
jgi:putative transcriptional regulator